MQVCFGRSLPPGTPRFRLEVAVEIRPDGSTGARVLRNDSGVAVVEGCVVNTISRFRFRPGPIGGVSRYRTAFEIIPR